MCANTLIFNFLLRTHLITITYILAQLYSENMMHWQLQIYQLVQYSTQDLVLSQGLDHWQLVLNKSGPITLIGPSPKYIIEPGPRCHIGLAYKIGKFPIGILLLPLNKERKKKSPIWMAHGISYSSVVFEPSCFLPGVHLLLSTFFLLQFSTHSLKIKACSILDFVNLHLVLTLLPWFSCKSWHFPNSPQATIFKSY